MKRIFSASFTIVALLFILSFCVSNGGRTEAAVIYSQVGPSPPIGAFSSNDAGNPTDQKIADNFLFSGSGPETIRSLRFIGGYGLTNPPPQTPPLDELPSDDFRIVLLTDSAGAPGPPLAGGNFHVDTPFSRTTTGGPLLGGIITPLQYVVDLGTGININSATVYWVSITNNVGKNYGWVWANTAGAYDQGVASTYDNVSTGPWQVSGGGGMFFELSDNNVPESGTIALLTTASFIILGLGRRYSHERRHGDAQHD